MTLPPTVLRWNVVRSGSRARTVRLVGAAGLALLVSGLGLSLGSEAANAQRREAPQSRGQVQTSFAPVVKRAAPAVVNIFVQARVRGGRSPFAGDPFFERFFGEQFGMPRERVENSLGSGVIVSEGGLVVTNTHVIKSSGASDIRVVLADRREFSARVIVSDEKTDITVLQIDGVNEALPTLDFADSDAVEVGDLVLAIGNPFGVGQTVTSGIISALSRSQIGRSEAQVFLQTDAAINPGNSGGALVDMQGRLVGINTAIYSRGGGSIGIGFAIPSNLVRLYVDSAASGRQVRSVWIGAKLEDVSSDIAASLGLARVVGAIVADVSRTGPARSAGLQIGDVIVSVDGREIEGARELRYRLTTIGMGNQARLGLLRQGRRSEVRFEVASAPEPGPDDVMALKGGHPLDGAVAANPIPGLLDAIDLPEGDGVVILRVDPGSTAASLGFRPRDRIVSIGGRNVTTLRDLTRALASTPATWDISVLRGDRRLRLRMRA
ncbi:MAG: Do family serine endopeptidase [Hyphomicrobiaceae bacterium]